MEIGYIREFDTSYLGYKEKLVLRFKFLFGIIKKEYVNNTLVYLLPITKSMKLNKRKIRRIATRLNNLLYKNDIEDVVLSNYLYNNELFKNLLYGQNINIFNGKKLFKYMTYNILEYICNIKNEDINSKEVSILINDLTPKNMQNIIYIANKIKRINIVTNHINSFKSLENKLYNDFGIIITISNNKKKSLLESKTIINFDFPNEIINKYSINNNAIIINIPEDIKINTKKFNGILINNFKISIPPKYKISEFSDEVIYESLVYKMNFVSIKKTIKNDNIKIEGLIGNCGEISKSEIK